MMSLTLEQFGIDRLDPQQRWELIGLLWDSLPEDLPFSLPDAHRRELEQRIVNADAHPEAAESWDTVLTRLMRKP